MLPKGIKNSVIYMPYTSKPIATSVTNRPIPTTPPLTNTLTFQHSISIHRQHIQVAKWKSGHNISPITDNLARTNSRMK
jgi:hypothetical protein